MEEGKHSQVDSTELIEEELEDDILEWDEMITTNCELLDVLLYSSPSVSPRTRQNDTYT